MARLSGTVSRYQGPECADTHRSSLSSHHQPQPGQAVGTQLDYGQTTTGSAANCRTVTAGVSYLVSIQKNYVFIPL